MYSAWFVRSVIFKPASNAVLKTVVDTWQTPPPSPVVTSPLTITGASRKPLAALRSPVVPLNENVVACATTHCRLEDRVGAGERVEPDARLRRHDGDVLAVDRERRILRGLRDALT